VATAGQNRDPALRDGYPADGVCRQNRGKGFQRVGRGSIPVAPTIQPPANPALSARRAVWRSVLRCVNMPRTVPECLAGLGNRRAQSSHIVPPAQQPEVQSQVPDATALMARLRSGGGRGPRPARTGMAGKVRLMRVRTVTYQYRGRRVRCRASYYLSVATLGLQRRTKSARPRSRTIALSVTPPGPPPTRRTMADIIDITFDVSDPWIRNGAARSPTREGTGSRSN
jgi:hypothetical protein